MPHSNAASEIEKRIESLPSLKETIVSNNLLARKSLGQNFILDSNLLDKIVRNAGSLKNQNVIEVGPGPGGLTRSLLMSDAKHVIVIEKDDRCLPILNALEKASDGKLSIIQGDALKTSISELSDTPYHIVANLPYNIGTTLLMGWLQDLERCSGMTLMFQKEVAERICARPNTKSYGRLSILIQWLCQTEFAFEVPAHAFTPMPKVTSAIVKITPRDRPLAPADKTALEHVTAQAFNQRRKMLRGSLKSLIPGPIENFLTDLNIDPTARPEQLDVPTWCAIARAFKEQAPEV